MIQTYIEQSTNKVRHVIELAIGEMAALKQNTLTPDFILLALLSQPDSDAIKILKQLIPNLVEVVARLKGEIFQQYQRPVESKQSQLLASEELEEIVVRLMPSRRGSGWGMIMSPPAPYFWLSSILNRDTLRHV